MSNKTLKIGIIGGSIKSTIGYTHIKAINLNKDFLIHCGFFSRNKKINNSTGESYKLKSNKIYTNINNFIQNEKKNIDAALIITPPNTKYDIIKKLVDNNVPIICEKPVCSDYLISKKIYYLVKKKKLFFTSTYNYTGYPAIREIKEIIYKKKLGKIISFNFELPQQTFVYNKSIIVKWRLKDYSIPTLYLDLCSHLINISKFLFNYYPTYVMSFSTKNKKYKIIDNVYAWLNYKNNMLGNIWFSKNSLGQRNGLKLRIFGTNLSVEWDHSKPEKINLYYKNGKIEVLDRASPNVKILNKQKYFTYSPGHPNGFLDAFANLYSDIYQGLIKYKFKKKIDYKYLVNEKDNANIISVLNSINQSSKKNKWVKTRIIQ